MTLDQLKVRVLKVWRSNSLEQRRNVYRNVLKLIADGKELNATPAEYARVVLELERIDGNQK